MNPPRPIGCSADSNDMNNHESLEGQGNEERDVEMRKVSFDYRGYRLSLLAMNAVAYFAEESCGVASLSMQEGTR